MALWRFGRSWSDAEMVRYLQEIADRPVNFSAPAGLMDAAHGWIVDGADARLGCEEPGPPTLNGLFERARLGVENYDFSDPRIVEGHFDPRSPLLGRNILLELKVFGLHYLAGVRVNQVKDERTASATLFGFRYDTLEGHVERGAEWFLLRKDHQTGEVFFKIEAHWKPGDFPNWWSRIGFLLVGRFFRSFWRRLAPLRLIKLAHRPVEAPAEAPGELAHRGETSPERTERVN